MKDTEKFKISKEKLDSQENVAGIYVSRRQIEGSHRVFVATDSSIISTEINIKLTFQGPVQQRLIPTTTTQKFISCLKRLIARRGKLSTISSDNTKSFLAAAK